MKYLQKIVEGRDLDSAEAEDLLAEVFNGATDAQIAASLIALRMKGESVSELAGLARTMRRSSVRIAPRVGGGLVDTCGTGGDGANTINVSTAAAIVAAASGVPVAKHGNYAVSSSCGSANVLEALGLDMQQRPDQVCRAIEDVGIGFMLAPLFHPYMKRVAALRREMGVRTVFNLLGPLTNPAGASAQLMGVYDPRLCPLLARVLGELGSERALVVHGGGMDEITNTSETAVSELKDGQVHSYAIAPEELGYRRARPEEIRGGRPEQNARTLIEILKGEPSRGRDLVEMNAGAAIYVSGRAGSIAEGCMIAQEAISTGKALRTLCALVERCGNPQVLGRYL